MLGSQCQLELQQRESAPCLDYSSLPFQQQETEVTYPVILPQQMQDPFPNMMYSVPDMQTSENTIFNTADPMSFDFELMGAGDDVILNNQWYNPG